MSKVIDERVVEMRFDNKQFESATKETLGSLGRLKEALKLPSLSGAFEDIDKAAKNTNLSGIAASLEALEKRFSTLGIVGMRVIENLTDAFMNKLSKAVDYATSKIVSGGIKRAMNIENAHFQLQALLKDETKVQAVMDDAMKSVDGTAYAFDEAAKAASQFAASGIQAGDKMLGALKGITGVAAMTNSSFEDISRIFTTIAGNGRLMGDQLLQLSSRGLNAASTLSDYFRQVRGEVSTTEADIREMVSKGKIDFQTFAEAMQWAFGESAERANETFTGAMANMGSAFARIGAGFVSPLIEQESELVKLFNSLRIQINNVKAALVFDEQKSAMSGLTKEADILVETVSGLVKNGTKDFETFTSAIIGTGRSEKELKKANEALAESYEKVKKNGTASVETLIEFQKNGLSASKAVRDYMNAVMDGSIKTSKEVKESIMEITGGTKVMSDEIIKFAEEGKISYDLFTDAIVYSSKLVQKGTAVSGEAVKSMMKQVQEQGFVTSDTLTKFTQNGIDAATALTNYMNGVTEGSIHASYSTSQAIKEITKGTKVGTDAVTEFAEQGVISYAILQSALEEMYGDQKLLSKQFTDFALDSIKMVKDTIDSWDLTKPLETFYYGVESIKNLGKGLYSVLKPVAGAFKDSFSSFSIDRIVELAAKVERMTAKLKLSEKQGNNLRKTFKGLFDVAKLLVDIFVALVKVVVPVNEPMGTLADVILSVTANIGGLLTKFTEWVRTSPVISKAYERVSESVRKTMHFISELIGGFGDFLKKVRELPAVQKIFDMISDAFSRLGKIFEPVFGDIGKKFKKFFGDIEASIPKDAQSFLDGLLGNIERFANSIDQDKVLNFLTSFTDKVEKFVNFIKSNDNLNTFVKNAKKFFEDLTDAFSIENILKKIDSVQEHLEKFVSWLKETIAPFFEGFTLGGALATAGSGGLLYVLVKLAKTFDKYGSIFASIPKMFNALKGVLVAYQKNLKADTLLKIAKSIAILAVSLTILSFADPEGLTQAGIALVVLGGLLVTALAIFNKIVSAVKKLPTIQEYIGKFLNKLGKAATQFAKAAKWKMIAKTIKSVGTSILEIAVAIVGLGLMAKKYPEAIESGIYLVSGIAVGIGIMIYAITKIGDSMALGMQSFSKTTSGVLAMCFGILIIVQAIKMLMKLELPTDRNELVLKIGLFAAAIFGLSALMLAIGKASKTAEGNKMKVGMLLGSVVSLILLVKALEMVLHLDLGDNPVGKIIIFAGLFVALGLLIEVIGEATKNAGGALKGTGVLIALSVALVILTGALGILSLLPIDKLVSSCFGLGVVLLALGYAFGMAGKITTGASWKPILSMAIVIATLTAALSLLSLIPWESLVPAIVALGATMWALSAVFKGIGSIKTNNFVEIVAMMALVGVIAYSLYELSSLPWDSLIAAGGALTLALIGVSAALFIVGKSNANLPAAVSFVAGAVALIPVAYALSMISDYNWDSLITAAGALGIVSLALAAALFIIGRDPLNIIGVAAFAAAALTLIPVAYVIQQLSGLKFGEVVTGLLSLAGGLIIIGGAGLVFGAMALPMTEGALALLVMSAAVAAAGVAILVFVWSVTTALDLLGDFLGRVWNAIGNIFEAGKNIVLGLIDGIKSGFSSLWDAAKDLGNGFIGWVKNIFGIHSPSDVMEEIGNFVIQGFNLGIEKGTPSVEKTVTSTFGNLSNLINTSSLMSSGKEMAESFGSGIVDQKDKIASLVKNVTDGKDIDVDTTVYENAGAQASSSFETGFMSGAYDTESMIKNAMSGSGIDLDYSQYFNMGDTASMSFMDGFSSGDGFSFDMSEIMNGVSGDIDLDSYFDTGKESGTQFLSGFQTGAQDSVKVANEVIKVLASNLSEFAKRQDMTEIGRTMVTKILKPFKDSLDLTSTSVKTFTSIIKKETDSVIPWIINGINAKRQGLISTVQILTDDVISRVRRTWSTDTCTKIGQDLVQWIVNGMTSRRVNVVNESDWVAKEILWKFQNTLSYTTFYFIGQSIMAGLTNGISSKDRDAAALMQNICQSIVREVNYELSYNDFYAAGQYAAAGLEDGIGSKIQEISNTAANAASSAINSVKSVFKIASPSKVMFGLGQYVSQGLANGIQNDSGRIVEATDEMSKEVLSRTSKVFEQLSSFIDHQNLDQIVELTPVMDLSTLRRDTETINKMFNSAIGYQYDGFNQANWNLQKNRQRKETEYYEEQAKQTEIASLLKQLNVDDFGKKTENNFYIQGEDPRAIAEEVSTILNRQTERKSVVWA